MPTVDPFEAHTDRYDRWFEEYEHAYRSELDAVGRLLPAGDGMEIGVGSGRFAGPLGVEVGVDPAGAMLERARARRRGGSRRRRGAPVRRRCLLLWAARDHHLLRQRR